MPAIESMLHSHGYSVVFVTNDGDAVSLRCGCVVDRNGRVIAGSNEATRWILTNCQLSDRDREHWSYRGEDVCRSMARSAMSSNEMHRMQHG